MKTKWILLIFTLLALTVFTIFVLNFGMRKKQLSGNFSSTEIRQIEVGMSLEQVYDILGPPFKISGLDGSHFFKCKNPKDGLEEDISESSNIRNIVRGKIENPDFCCEAYKESVRKEVSLTYTKPVMSSRLYPMLWVHLDSAFQVSSVYAKQYILWGADDFAIYSLDKKGKHGNDELFEKNFN